MSKSPMRTKGLQEEQKSKPACSPNALPAARLQNLLGQIMHIDRCCCPRCRLLRCEYCFRRGSFYAIEKPTSSLLWCYEPLEVHVGRTTATHCSNFFWILMILGGWFYCYYVATVLGTINFSSYCGQNQFAPYAMKAMLKRHGAKTISVPLGQYGAQSE